MQTRPATIAIFSQSYAFAELVRWVLVDQIGARVQVFSRLSELELHAHAGKIEVVIIDAELGSLDAAEAGALMLDIKASSETGMRSIALTRQINGWSRTRCKGAGFDEVLLKPMSPLLLSERVMAQLAKSVAQSDRALPDMSNVIALADWKSKRAHLPRDI